jgi:hypothetical protein
MSAGYVIIGEYSVTYNVSHEPSEFSVIIRLSSEHNTFHIIHNY